MGVAHGINCSIWYSLISIRLFHQKKATNTMYAYLKVGKTPPVDYYGTEGFTFSISHQKEMSITIPHLLSYKMQLFAMLPLFLFCWLNYLCENAKL